MDLVASLNHGFLRRGDGLGRDHSSSLALDLPCTESPAGPWTLNQPFRQKEPRCMTFPCLMKRARPIEDLPIGHRSIHRLDPVFSPGWVGGENFKVWLSGLRHWFAKSTYKKIVSWVRIPFPPARKFNGRAKLRERKNLLVESSPPEDRIALLSY
nr:hypothetical protein TanjilG_32901 [Ipomoea batatas]GMD77933.1 hypothetical protein TanjilG_32901 [Ipomoea batatas]